MSSASPVRRPATVLLCLLALAGCATTGDGSRVIGRSDRFLVVLPGQGASARSLARDHLGDVGRYWMIEDANGTREIRPGRPLVVPRKPWNPTGVTAGGYQTVPVLAYHKLGGPASAMNVTADMFRRQMRYLREHHYRVVPLAHLTGFLEGRRQLPQRAVVITFDDGYRSTYDIAFPILKQFGYPATLFVYTDYIGNGGVTREQLREMTGSGIFTVLPHSKTHGNLALRAAGEDEAAYRKRLRREIAEPRRRLGATVSGPLFGYAYPYGDANREVMALLREEDYALGATVQAGGNPAFAPPLLLRRTMIFGNRDMKRFASALDVFEERPAK